MIAFLAKGILRDKTRSLFPLLIVSLMVTLIIFFKGFMLGVMNSVINDTAIISTGYLKVTTKAYDEEEEAQSSINYEKDALYDEALDIVKQTKLASISMIQRRLKIGYNRAANIIEMMEREGIIGEQESAGKPRKVFL